MTSKDSLELGRIGGPYGIKGWVHVQSYTTPPEKLLKYREWTLVTAQRWRHGTSQGGGRPAAGQGRRGSARRLRRSGSRGAATGPRWFM